MPSFPAAEEYADISDSLFAEENGEVQGVVAMLIGAIDEERSFVSGEETSVFEEAREAFFIGKGDGARDMAGEIVGEGSSVEDEMG